MGRSYANNYSGREYDHRKQPYFLDSCFLCHKPLPQNSDIFMYRGDTAFCSQECRQEEIDMDESAEKRWKVSSSKKSNPSTARQKITESDKESHSHTKKTVAVA